MLKAPENIEYRISVVQSKPWRMIVTLTEYEVVKRKMVATGRAWSEPFDPVRGDQEELEARFRRQITTTPSPPIVSPAEELQHRLEGTLSDKPLASLRLFSFRKKG